MLVVPPRPDPGARSPSRSWVLAVGFYLAEAKVIHLHIGRSAHSFSMSELPLVAGLFLVSPPAFIVARLIGSGLALFFNRRQRSVKLAFNLAQFGLRSVVSVAIVHVGGRRPTALRAVALGGCPRWSRWSRTSSACSASAPRSRWPKGTPSTGASPRCSRSAILVSLTNASLALMGLTVLWANPESVWLFIVPTATAALAYRAYISERQQHESIELLYESTRILQRSPQLDTAHRVAARPRPQDVPRRRGRDPAAAAA